CHVRIDPPGFALENYDPSGKWRDVYRFAGGAKTSRIPIDASHVMPDGAAFDGIAQFKRLVLRDRQRIARGLAEHLVTYGTGATVGFADRDAVEQLVARSQQNDFGFRSIVASVATSDLFLSK